MSRPQDMPEQRALPFNRRAQHDAKRSAILSEAARLFNGKGSRATTLQDIAAGLGLTKTSLYYYVRTKEALIHQCYEATLDRQHEALDEIERNHRSARERLSAFVRLQFDNWLDAAEGRAPHQAALLEIASLKDTQRASVEGRYIELFKRLRSYVRSGVAEGELCTRESTATTRALIGSMDWVFNWLHEVPRDAVQACADDAVDLLLHGLHAGERQYVPEPMPEVPSPEAGSAGFDRDQQNRLKQEAFFKAGTWFFNKKGFNGASLDEIAEYLQVSKGAFYYHIRNKEDLLYQCYEHTLDRLAGVYAAVDTQGGSGLQRIERSARQIFVIQNSSLGPLIRYNTITALPIERRRRVLARTDATNEHFVAYLRAGQADGSVRAVNPLLARNLFTGAINASMDISLWRRVDNLDDAALDYIDIFLNGLLPRTTA